jgi:hypothetical protein
MINGFEGPNEVVVGSHSARVGQMESLWHYYSVAACVQVPTRCLFRSGGPRKITSPVSVGRGIVNIGFLIDRQDRHNRKLDADSFVEMEGYLTDAK